MARFYPDKPLFTDTAGLKAWSVIHRALDSRWQVWQRLPGRSGPDFYLLDDQARTLVIKVCDATPSHIRKNAQPGLFSLLDKEQESLPSWELAFDELSAFLVAMGGEEGPEVAVFFPHLRTEEVEDICRYQRPPDIALAASEDLTKTRFVEWTEQHISTPRPPPLLENLRRIFAPEAIVPLRNTAKRRRPEGRSAAFTEFLLDYDQEWYSKLDLGLPDEARPKADDFSIRLLTGPAGSGKSLVLLHRAALLAELFANARILLITHNKPLIGELRRRFERISDAGQRVEATSFFKWARNMYAQVNRSSFTIVDYTKRDQLVAAAVKQQLQHSELPASFVAEEFDWIKDQMIPSLEEYLSADRRGRGRSLNKSQRQRLYAAYQTYQHSLNGDPDWAALAPRVVNAIDDGALQPKRYDFILLDEAQFASPSWIELIKRCMKPKTGSLFLTADPGQGFLKSGKSWQSVGLSVTGRAHRLNAVYRTTSAIMDAAVRFYLSRHSIEEADFIIAERNLAEQGDPPKILEMRDERDEVQRIANEIGELLDQGVPPADLLILTPEWEHQKLLETALRKRLGHERIWDYRSNNEPMPGAVRYCLINAATGLESPIVFLCGMHRILEPEQNPLLDEDQRTAKRLENSRKIYMAMTRAAVKLVISGKVGISAILG